MSISIHFTRVSIMTKKLIYVLCLLSLIIQGSHAEERGFSVQPVSTPQVDREHFLTVLTTQVGTDIKPIHISLREGNQTHKNGEVLHFNIEPGENGKALNALTLFNLAGNGELQFVYPFANDPVRIQNFPYTLAIQVAPPFGEDTLVVVLCNQLTADLHILLTKSQPNIPEPEQVINLIHQNHCQVGQYAFKSEM